MMREGTTGQKQNGRREYNPGKPSLAAVDSSESLSGTWGRDGKVEEKSLPAAEIYGQRKLSCGCGYKYEVVSP